jgi:CRP-like cAMP-binding protein
MSVGIDIIQHIELFKGFNVNELKKFDVFIEHANVKEGETLYRKNKPAINLYIILIGSFMVHYEKGKAFIFNKKGEIMGLATMLSPFNYQGTAVSLIDGKVLVIKSSELLNLIKNDSELGGKFMKKLNTLIEKRALFFKKCLK